MLARTQSKAHGGQIARLSFQQHTKQSFRGYQTRRAPEPASPEVSRLLASFVQQPSTPLTLSALLSNARPASEASVLASVAHVQAEVPRRLAARIASLEALPYIVGTNPHVARTLRGYRDSFVWLATQPPVRTLVDNGPFTQKLAAIVDKHADDLPRIARG
jgi:26S proteasome regulatory subunit T1